MVDFLQNEKKQDNQNELSKVNKKQQSWLRGLLHPVNGKSESIDLLALAKKQNLEELGIKANNNISNNNFKDKIGVEKDKSPKIKLETEGSEKISRGFGVNLLPATISFQSTNKIMVILSLWFVVTLVVLGVIYIGMVFYGQQVTEEGLALEAEIQYLDSEIIKYNSDLVDASRWQVKLLAVDSLLKSHIYWTNFFSVLEKTTLPEVYYSGFTASLINSDINLVSYAKSFTTVAEQLIAYDRFPEIFGSFSVAEASLDEGVGINYNALVNLKRSLYYDQAFVKKSE